jgi:septal ring factor EnvC (AmiA/AmiB activator)
MMSDKIEEIRERFTNGAPWTRTTLQDDIATLLAEVERLRWALEVEGLRLAACDVVAMADTPESADRARQMQSGLRSAALSSVERRVDEVIALRAENERLRGALERRDAEITRLRAEGAASQTDITRLRARVAELEQKRISASDALKMVMALWGAGFREGELERRPAVSNATLQKHNDHAERCKSAIISALTWEAKP